MKTCNYKEETGCYNISFDRNCNIIIEDNSYNCNYVQVFIMDYNNSGKTQTIIKNDRYKEIVFNYKGDGLYTFCKVTVSKDETDPYYYKNNKFFHLGSQITLQELLEINPEVSKIKLEYINYFSTCNLKKCFIKICQDIFKSSNSVCEKSNVDGTLTYKRDLLWSALNVIKYFTEMNQFEEAQRLLEQLSECNGLCPSQNNNNFSGCGCGK